MPRSIWKGSISFGLVQIPVGLFPAEAPAQLSFRQVDRRTRSAIGYRKYNKETGEDIAPEQVVKAFDYGAFQRYAGSAEPTPAPAAPRREEPPPAVQPDSEEAPKEVG